MPNNTFIDVEKLNKQELTELLHQTVEELKKYGSGTLKKGQKIFVDTKHANDDPDLAKYYKIVSNKFAVVSDPNWDEWSTDENGNVIPFIEIRVENVGRHKYFSIHPEDAIPIE